MYFSVWSEGQFVEQIDYTPSSLAKQCTRDLQGRLALQLQSGRYQPVHGVQADLSGGIVKPLENFARRSGLQREKP